MADISASVGENGVNRRDDVIAVQKLLLARRYAIGSADGICGPKTKGAIRSFQSGFLHNPDGRVDPGGTTWRRLNEGGTTVPPGTQDPTPGTDPASLVKLIALPDRSTLNPGIRSVNSQFMLSTFGAPRENYSQNDQPVTNARLKRNMTTAQVGPFRVTGLKPAVNSLQQVLAEVQSKQPDVYRVLGTAGMLCCRNVRGSTTAISNHSWGCAVDLTLHGRLDTRGDNKVQFGLTLIAPIFNRHGWFWGAGFPTEDAMHFEGGRTIAEAWSRQLT